MGYSIKVGVAQARPSGGAAGAMLDAERDLVVLREVTGGNANSHAQDEMPDVVLLDIPEDEPEPRGLVRRVAAEHPTAHVMVVACSEDRRSLDDALRAGARGYVVKPMDHEALVGALRLVAAGHLVIDGRFAGDRIAAVTGRRRSSLKARDMIMTERDVDVLTAAASGRSDEEIAAALGVSVTTVRRHLAGVLPTLGVTDREAAVAAARRMRYLLGRGRGGYGIWDVTTPGDPVERFDEGQRAAAWVRWQQLREDRRGRPFRQLWARRSPQR